MNAAIPTVSQHGENLQATFAPHSGQNFAPRTRLVIPETKRYYVDNFVSVPDQMKGRTRAAVVIAAVALVAVGLFGAYFVIPSQGTAAIYMKDPVAAGWSALFINISSVSIHNSTGAGDGGYSATFATPLEVNLVQAATTSKFLADLHLPAGHYQMIRFTVFDASGVYQGKHYSLSLVLSTVGVAGQFTVPSRGTVSITLDFDSASSIHGTPASGFTLNPVVGETVGS